MRHADIRAALLKTAAANPRPLGWDLYDVDRIAFNIKLALDALSPKRPEDISICDIGGGVGLFSIGCAALGMKSTLVDDFRDPVNLRIGESAIAPHRAMGVTVIQRDAVAEGIADLPSFDAVTTFDSMEHWHHSPKRLFAQIRGRLNPGGVFVLGVPNAVNLRKRIAVPLGMSKWSSMGDWYENESFRGHVREPDISDLRYIARDMRLSVVRIVGRNWQGYNSGNRLVRTAAAILDYPLRLNPALCSDIYLVGHKV